MGWSVNSAVLGTVRSGVAVSSDYHVGMTASFTPSRLIIASKYTIVVCSILSRSYMMTEGHRVVQ